VRLRSLGPATVVAVVLCACAADGPAGPSAVPLDRDFDLRPGESVSVSGAGLFVRFVAVTEDSRCPAGAQCVSAGDATVRLAVRQEGSREMPVDLHTTMGPDEKALGDYWIRLRGLAPLPRSGQPVPPRDYLATLRVIRAA